MLLVLTFLILSVVFIIIIFSTIKIEIVNFEVSNIMRISSRCYKIKLSVFLFEKIKLFSLKLNSNIIKKIYTKFNRKKFDIKSGMNILKNKEISNIIKKFKLECLNLDLSLGTEDVILTTELIVLVSTIISNVLPHITKKYIPNKYIYKVNPIYINKIAYHIVLNCIFEVKIVHIINIIYIYLKKGKSDKNE